MAKGKPQRVARRTVLESRLASHLPCLAEDTTDPELPRAERLALVWERVERIRGLRRELERDT
jgi:hypothetical protein